MDKFDFISSFYAKEHDRESLVRGLDSLLITDDIYVKAIPFASDISPFDRLSDAHLRNRDVSIVYSTAEVTLFKLYYRFKQSDSPRKGFGRFFIVKHPSFANIYLIIALEQSIFYYKALLPLVESLYPRFILTFISHNKLRFLLNNFMKENSIASIKIIRASHRIRLDNGWTRKKVVPLISWPDMELEEAFEWVQQNNGWFQSLQFEANRDRSIFATISINRQGIVGTTSQFGNILSTLLMPICDIINANLKLFGNRSRRDIADKSARPLVIDFGFNKLEDPTDNEKFIRALRLFKSSSISVFHGNPYIHATVIDYFDGSTFDLWVLNQSQIIIVPQLKGSFFSIKRLVNHIFDTYAEGKIIDHVEANR